jgi:hypothetical protein
MIEQDAETDGLIIIVWLRPTFTWSPAISRSLDAAMKVSSITKEDIDIYDFYSYVIHSPAHHI